MASWTEDLIGTPSSITAKNSKCHVVYVVLLVSVQQKVLIFLYWRFAIAFDAPSYLTTVDGFLPSLLGDMVEHV
ncbi:unnamed protein product [Sphenostylis stenocarpa]|uniref:Uncharacterized protein n=1 Tax=Sphenostylis stenocarpa TaxID=92480 RepID=A0AA86ST52_9FABA|nr:unnamed protein product [Sphenostylis stenocarpa]